MLTLQCCRCAVRDTVVLPSFSPHDWGLLVPWFQEGPSEAAALRFALGWERFSLPFPDALSRAMAWALRAHVLPLRHCRCSHFPVFYLTKLCPLVGLLCLFCPALSLFCSSFVFLFPHFAVSFRKIRLTCVRGRHAIAISNDVNI